ncbi:hypothetical protein DFJ74DRAFT_712071 [Hyaloraphidium curvatum]|nr:hypothetical protein DFJ74DRAFT_712071 [Hyaloraphidium curvatum]
MAARAALEARTDVLKVPVLGDALCVLGTPYDARTDQFIPGVTLWDPQALVGVTDVPGADESHELFSGDTFDDVCNSLDISAAVKGSFMGGLVSVSGSANYMRREKSNSRTARVTFRHKLRTGFQMLNMSQLGANRIAHGQVFDHGVATHVVVGLAKGTDAFLDFQHTVAAGEDVATVQGNLQIAVDLVAVAVSGGGSVDVRDFHQFSSAQTTTNYQGDVPLGMVVHSFADACEAMRRIVSVDRRQDVRAKVAYLYPLALLDDRAARLQRQVKDSQLSAAEGVFMGLREAAELARTVEEADPLVPKLLLSEGLQPSLSASLRSCQARFSGALGPLLRGIRGAEADRAAAAEDGLAELLARWAAPVAAIRGALLRVQDAVKYPGLWFRSLRDAGIPEAFGPAFADVDVRNDRVLSAVFHLPPILRQAKDALAAFAAGLGADGLPPAFPAIGPGFSDSGPAFDAAGTTVRTAAAFAEQAGALNVAVVVRGGPAREDGTPVSISFRHRSREVPFPGCPSLPTNLRASRISSTSFLLEWDADPGFASSYVVSVQGDWTGERHASAQGPGPWSCLVAGLPEGSTVRATVRAVVHLGPCGFRGEAPPALVVPLESTVGELAYCNALELAPMVRRVIASIPEQEFRADTICEVLARRLIREDHGRHYYAVTNCAPRAGYFAGLLVAHMVIRIHGRKLHVAALLNNRNINVFPLHRPATAEAVNNMGMIVQSIYWLSTESPAFTVLLADSLVDMDLSKRDAPEWLSYRLMKGCRERGIGPYYAVVAHAASANRHESFIDLLMGQFVVVQGDIVYHVLMALDGRDLTPYLPA